MTCAWHACLCGIWPVQWWLQPKSRPQPDSVDVRKIVVFWHRHFFTVCMGLGRRWLRSKMAQKVNSYDYDTNMIVAHMQQHTTSRPVRSFVRYCAPSELFHFGVNSYLDKLSLLGVFALSGEASSSARVLCSLRPQFIVMLFSLTKPFIYSVCIHVRSSK